MPRQVKICTSLTLRQEFSIEIPDKDADAIHSGRSQSNMQSCGPSSNAIKVDKAVEYILAQPDGQFAHAILPASRSNANIFPAH